MDTLELAKTFFLAGLKSLENGKFQEAEYSFLESLKLAPGRPSILNNLAATQIKLKKFNEAEKNLQEVNRVDEKSVDLWLNLGILSLAKNQSTEAISNFEKCIELDSQHIFAWKFLAQIHDQNQEFTQAITCFKKILELNPNDLDALIGLGAVLNDLKEYNESIYYHQLAIKIDPRSISAYVNIGVALHGLEKFDLALHNYAIALELDPFDSEIWLNKGVTLHSLKCYEDAIAHCDRVISLKPDYAQGWSNKGNALYEIKRYEDAIAHYDKALSLKPDYHDAWSNKGVALKELKRYEDAITHYDQAISLKPDYHEAWSNKGVALCELKRYDQAITHYDQAISLKPDYHEAWSNKGVALKELKRYEEAITCYDKALSLKPDYHGAWVNKGIALCELKRYDEAIACYDNALNLKPDIDWATGDLFHAKMKIGSWSGLAESLEHLSKKVVANEKVANPFLLLALNDDALLHKKSSEVYVQSRYSFNSVLGPLFKHPKSQKIRVGYFSADFHNHATGYLMAELFELHDKNQFELVGFSFGPIVNDEMRQRLEKSFDRFIEVGSMSDIEIAQLSRKLAIDIAIDLKGFTQDSRTEIFSYRAAPIQVNYLGYPGTMGADYIDYIIADRTLIPDQSQQFYAEKIVYLPNSYQVNDRKRAISDRKFTRQELGLPEKGFVFCCFNNNYKILPETFDGWMRILKAVQGSVIWLLADNPMAKDNLIKEAIAREVDCSRLVFAEHMLLSEHLARQHQADLFLDTVPYNAHTTTSDALWAGLPVLTLMGQSFASRVAASLLNAIGLSELITSTQEEYESLAIELAMNPQKLADIKLRLANNRLTAPLFNTPLFTKNLEATYIKMYERYQADLEPEHISIT